MRLNEIARESKSTFKGDKTDLPIVGLEHLIPGELTLTEYDVNTKNTFTKFFRKGQVLFGRRRAYLKKASLAEFDGVCSGDIIVIEPIEGKVYPDLLPFIIQNDRFFAYAVSKSAGGLSPRVKWQDIADYELSLPSLSAQRELSKKLWAAYRLKESYKKLLLATRDMVKSQFIEMFKGTYPTEKWEQCLTITNGKKYKGEYQSSGLFPICGSAGVMGYGDCKLCNKDTIILGRKGNINSPIYMDKDYWVVDTAFSLDVDKDKLNPVYFFFWCKLFDFTKYNKQGVLPSLTKSDLLTIEMPLPPMELQRQFVALYRQADKSEFELKKSIEAIDAVIKSLINN